MKRKWFDEVLFDLTDLWLYPWRDVGLQDSMLTFYRPDLQLQAGRVGLAPIGGKKKISVLKIKTVVIFECSK